MSETFANDTTQMHAFWALLQKEFVVTIQQVRYGKCETDGSWTHFWGILVNVEVKNEIGSGGRTPMLRMLLLMLLKLTYIGFHFVRPCS